MKCIVGLGNPGEKYARTRHNVGFMVVEGLLKTLQIAESSEHSLEQGSELSFAFSKKFNAEIVQAKDFILVKPMTFMNESGKVVAAISQFYKIKQGNTYVIHDDLDIELGEYKLQLGRGPKVHYGVGSIEEGWGGKEFWRMRVGVENRQIRGNKGVLGEVYSLQNFSIEEEEKFQRVKEKVVAELISVLF